MAKSDVIDRLVGELEPVRPLRIARIYALCFGVQALVAVLAARVFGIDADAFARLGDPVQAAVVGVLAVSSIAATVVACRSAIPGLGVPRAVSATLVFVPAVLALWVWLVPPWGGTWVGTANTLAQGKGCMAQITGVALLPWLAVVLVLRYLAPLREFATGLFVGLSAFLLGALAVQLACDVTDNYHLAMTHFAPTAVGAVIAGLLSVRFLRSN